MKNYIVSYEYILDYVLKLENSIKEYAQNNRDLWNGYTNKKAYDAGDRFAEKTYWSIEEYDYHIYSNKLNQYKTYIKLCDLVADLKRQDCKVGGINSNINHELINIKPSFLVGYYETVKQEIEQLENNPIEYPIAV